MRPAQVEACGPEPTMVSFTLEGHTHPDEPFDDFARGRLGIISSEWDASFRVIAYRWMMGLDLDPTEQRAMVDYWDRDHERSWEWWVEPGYAIDRWHEARVLVPGAPPSPISDSYVSSWEPDGYHPRFLCASDAFFTAADTLKARIARFGADSSEVRSWLEAQDIVFSNCGSDELRLPPPAPAGAAPLLRADRAYQRAAAHFYACGYEDAAALFRGIARDDSSPWQKLGGYLAARSLTRKAMSRPEDKAVHARARAAIQQVLIDPGQQETHHAAWALWRTLRPEADRVAARQVRARELVSPRIGPQLTDILDDFVTLSGTPATGPLEDLVTWIDTFEQAKPDPNEGWAAQDARWWERADPLERWRATRSLPWLAAALSGLVAANVPPEMLHAAAAVSPRSPAWVTVTFHLARLKLQAGDEGTAKRLLDAMLEGRGGPLPPSARNQVLKLRTGLARTFDEFVTLAPRYPADIGGVPPREYNAGRGPGGWAMFDADAVTVFNRLLPLRMLSEAAVSRRLPGQLRQEVAEMAWARAILLEREDLARPLAVLLRSISPRLRDGLSAWLAAGDRDSRRFAAADLLIRHRDIPVVLDEGPALGGWLAEGEEKEWCAVESTGPLPPPPRFLTPADRTIAASEWQRLTGLPVASTWIGRAVLAYAKSHPDDPRLPEALHRVVQLGRRHCTSDESRRLFQEAFRRLHHQYPANPWTKRTRHWYAG